VVRHNVGWLASKKLEVAAVSESTGGNADGFGDFRVTVNAHVDADGKIFSITNRQEAALLRKVTFVINVFASPTNPYIEQVVPDHPKLSPTPSQLRLLACAVLHANEEWSKTISQRDAEFNAKIEETAKKNPERAAMMRKAFEQIRRKANPSK